MLLGLYAWLLLCVWELLGLDVRLLLCVGAAECLVQYNHYTIKFSKNYQIITRWEYEPA